MRRKQANKKKLRVPVSAMTVLAVCSVIFWYNVLSYDAFVPLVNAADSKIAVSVNESTKTTASIGVPVRIKIKSIGVDALVEKTGLAKDGSMGVPKHPQDTSWYELGPRPGEMGSAAIAGHVDWYSGAKGVFKYLYKLKAGDTITIQDDKGVVSTFVVRESKTYGYTDDASAVFKSTDGKSHLNLITCGGTWIKRVRQYSKRLVVFADLKIE